MLLKTVVLRVVGNAWDENGLSAVSRRKGLSARNAAKKAKRKKGEKCPEARIHTQYKLRPYPSREQK